MPKNVAGLSRITQKSHFLVFGENDEIKQNSGSRDSDGNVPNVNWNSDKVNVNWNHPSNANDNLRSRFVEVSGKKEPRIFRALLLRNISASQKSFLIFLPVVFARRYIFENQSRLIRRLF